MSILRLVLSMCMIIHQQMIKNEHKLHDISSSIVFCWSIQQHKLPKKSSEDYLSSRLSIRTIKNIGHGLRFRAIVMFHTWLPDSFLLCLSILYFGVGFSTYAYKENNDPKTLIMHIFLLRVYTLNLGLKLLLFHFCHFRFLQSNSSLLCSVSTVPYTLKRSR